jgi:hypothetical protein
MMMDPKKCFLAPFRCHGSLMRVLNQFKNKASAWKTTQKHKCRKHLYSSKIYPKRTLVLYSKLLDKWWITQKAHPQHDLVVKSTSKPPTKARTIHEVGSHHSTLKCQEEDSRWIWAQSQRTKLSTAAKGQSSWQPIAVLQNRLTL